MRGDWLTTGPYVAEFEQRLAAIAGGHQTVSCSSGTAALHMAYASLGIGPGDEVVTTPMTFIATASCASQLGATVVFADVDPDTALLDPVAVEAVVTQQTKVIAAVDYAGQPCDYDSLQRIADQAGALTLDDAAHAIGGNYKGRPVGDLADLTTFSFFPTKNLTTAEGGALIAKNSAVAQRAQEFHVIGLVRDSNRFLIETEGSWHQEVHEFGLNYRLSDIASALGISQLNRLTSFKRRRAEIFQRYSSALADVEGLRLPVVRDDVDPVWHLFPVRILEGRRREVFDTMRQQGIGVQVNYLPVYWHPVYAQAGYKRGSCPNAEAFYAEELSLPMHADLSDNEIDQVVDVLVGSLK